MSQEINLGVENVENIKNNIFSFLYKMFLIVSYIKICNFIKYDIFLYKVIAFICFKII